jgi:hypothetical protein
MAVMTVYEPYYPMEKLVRFNHSIASRSLNQAERIYTTRVRELLAIVWATKHFSPYIYGRTFKIVSDHKPLVWVL